MDRLPKPGQLYNHFKNKPYQIITVATHADTREEMVVYQALYGDFKCYIRPLDNFLSEVDHKKYPDVKQKYRFELRTPKEMEACLTENAAKKEETSQHATNKVGQVADKADKDEHQQIAEMDIKHGNTLNEADARFDQSETMSDSVNSVLLQFLDADSYYKKLEVITSNRKHMSDRLINDMAVSLDCTVEEGPLEQRIHGLIYCLQAMSRFEDKRLR